MPDCLLVSTVHDSIVVDCPQDKVQDVTSIMVKVFDDIPLNVKKLFNITLPCPFPGEVKVGTTLGDMEKDV